jgi:hypothetical protein
MNWFIIGMLLAGNGQHVGGNVFVEVKRHGCSGDYPSLMSVSNIRQFFPHHGYTIVETFQGDNVFICKPFEEFKESLKLKGK